MRGRSIEERFWSFIEFDTNGGCWLWSGACHEFGYGNLRIGGRAGNVVRTNRLSWTIHFGPIPDGLHVLHKCDVPQCVRPDHLYLGTNLENAADRAARGTARGGSLAGEASPNRKLTAADVIEIRRCLAAGEGSQPAIAERYGVTQANISRIVRGETWRSIL